MSTIDKSQNYTNKTEYNTFYKEDEVEDEENNNKKSHLNNINLYFKTFNNFFKKPKIKLIKNNKTPIKLYKIKYSSLRKSSGEKKYIFKPHSSLFDNEQNYKDSLFLEIIRGKKNTKEINQKLKQLYNDYYTL